MVLQFFSYEIWNIHIDKLLTKNTKIYTYDSIIMSTCSVCGEHFSDDIRFLNHMMEKHGFRNPNIDKPDRNSRGY